MLKKISINLLDFQNKEMDRIVHVGVEYRPSEYEKLFLFIDFKIWTFVI